MDCDDAAELETIRRTYRKGQRVRFLGFGDPDAAKLPPGTEGTVSNVDDLGTVHVHWDNGLRLGVIVKRGLERPPDRIQLL